MRSFTWYSFLILCYIIWHPYMEPIQFPLLCLVIALAAVLIYDVLFVWTGLMEGWMELLHEEDSKKMKTMTVITSNGELFADITPCDG